MSFKVLQNKGTLLKTSIRIVLVWLLIQICLLVLIGSNILNIVLASSRAEFNTVPSTVIRTDNLVRGLKLSGLGFWNLSQPKQHLDLLNESLTLVAVGSAAISKISDLAKHSLNDRPLDPKNLEQLTRQLLIINSLVDSTIQKTQTSALMAIIKRVSPQTREKLDNHLLQITFLNSHAPDLIDTLPDLLGMYEPKKYIVLLQNNMELRPTGGFMGSYAQIILDKGSLTQLIIQDIYEPDGQISGYVEEPEPIKQYLFAGDHPGWRLRDSNWDPDFPRASRVIEWFFNQGNIQDINGIIAVNLDLAYEIIRVLGPIYLSDYDLTIDADNFYQHAQFHAEHDFFPGSTQKRDFLGSIIRQIILITSQDPERISLDLMRVTLQQLNQNQILISVFDDKSAGVFSELGWDGALIKRNGKDYLMLLEANLGSNKANCCIERKVKHYITINNETANHRLLISYKNNNPRSPIPPVYWGGGYNNFVRVYLPDHARLKYVLVEGEAIDADNIYTQQQGDKKYYGTRVLVPGERQKSIEFHWQTRVEFPDEKYQIIIQKQSGISKIDWFTYINQAYINNAVDVRSGAIYPSTPLITSQIINDMIGY